MINIERIDSSSTLSIRLKKDNEQFLEISLYGNRDLYFNLIYPENNNNFIIDKNNKAVYNAFEKLYNKISSSNIYKLNNFQLEQLKLACRYDHLNFEKEYNKLVEKIESSNLYLKNSEVYKKKYSENKIKWINDNDTLDDFSYFEINKENENYIISFNSNNKEKDISDILISIRIANKNSRLEPYNIVFNELFKELLKITDSYNQIPVDEYIYKQNLEKVLTKRDR